MEKKEIRQRLQWVKLYEESGDAGLVCRRCGISRPTLRKWWNRYQVQGVDGLKSHSRRPHSSPTAKINQEYESLILALRTERNLGARRIQSELKRLHKITLSVASIHKVLSRQHVKPLVAFRCKADFIRYQRPIPGERVQMDTCKIAPGRYQYTAIDDCTRYRVLRLYSRRTAQNTLDFIEAAVEEMPFPIQRIQTDRGREFFAVKVQEMLKNYGIKFRPNKPASPHLNGKVERSQKTDKIEFYSTVALSSATLNSLLAEWQHYYNWERPHSAHKGRTPMERYFELSGQTPFSEEVAEDYHPDQEYIQEQSYRLELQLRKLKRCL
jgi:transposase InsO family protein